MVFLIENGALVAKRGGETLRIEAWGKNAQLESCAVFQFGVMYQIGRDEGSCMSFLDAHLATHAASR